MNIKWNTVTWYSKLAAVVVFLATFIVAFDLGILWEETHIETALITTPSTIRRTTSHQTPVSTTTSTTTSVTGTTSVSGGSLGASCGGFIKNAPTCAAGLHCKLGVIADKGGVCVKN